MNRHSLLYTRGLNQHIKPMRVYCPIENIGADTISITDPNQLHHLLHVLRLKKEDVIGIFDGNKEYECRVCDISKTKIEARILKVKKVKASSALNIALACAIPKKVKLDYIIEKCTELGVNRIIPLITERTIVRIEGEKAAAKLRRWEKIAREASQQSGRVSFPVIDEVQKFDQAVLLTKDYDLALIPNLKSGNINIREAAGKFKGKSVIVFIGPEGDFSEKEIKLAEDSGCTSVSLGKLVLKVDTAAMAIVSFLRLQQ